MTVTIDKATIADVAQLQAISKQTFIETFAEQNSEENMQKYLNEALSLEQLTLELQDENSEFYFARIGDEIVGYLKLNSGASQTELKDKTAIEIERIYVLKQFHGQKVGQVLYEKAINIARQKNAKYVWLGVWEKNLRAINFYKKNGFTEFNKHIFKLGDDEQTDIMMRLEL